MTLPRPARLPWRFSRRLVRCVWAAPCSRVGGAVALATLPFGARLRWHEGVVELALARPGTRRFEALRLLPFDAITFGQVVLGRSTRELDALRAHEHAHVRQYERWGLLFFVAYPLASLQAWMSGQHFYRHNRFEVQACAAAFQAEARPDPQRLSRA